MASTGAAPRDESTTRTAVALAAAAAIAWVILAAMDHDGAGWLLVPVLGLAAAIMAWRAGGTSPRNMPAFVAFIVGVLAVLSFLIWLIVGE